MARKRSTKATRGGATKGASTKSASTRSTRKTSATIENSKVAEAVETTNTGVTEASQPVEEPKVEVAATVSVPKETPEDTLAKTSAKPAEKPTAKPSEKLPVQIENYFEINAEQIKVEDVVAKIYDSYKATGHRVGNIKTLQTYYNFEERRCYYVVNDKAEGLFVEF